jgi:hypothetical protein
MFLFLIICILLVVIYVALKTAAIAKDQMAITEYLQTELREVKAAQKIPVKPLAYGWFDDGFPADPSREEERGPLENPAPHKGADEYMTQAFIAEFRAMPSAHQRNEYLRQLWTAGTWMAADFLDTIYADGSEYVRAWAAGHLSVDFKDYSDWEHPIEVRNYEPILLADHSPIVRAAYWSNPRCQRLPWSAIRIAETWKEHFQRLTQLERLGLMRNPQLSMNYVVALMETPSEELKISQNEHIVVLTAAGQNPHLINNSRHTGRGMWEYRGDPNSPFEEYGQMWKLALDKWIDKPPVPFVFIKYIQTTPEVKLETYNRLLEKREANDMKWLRREVIRSCDPFDDKDVLKAAWGDPDEECRKIAQERVGALTNYVGVKPRERA